MASRTWVLAAIPGSFAFLIAGCSSSPGAFGTRFTERGRLLMEGAPAGMTVSTLSEADADAVPLLYGFAIKAHQIPYQIGATRTIDQQQAVLMGNSIDWSAVTRVGEGYVDIQCDRFLAALDELERSKRATLANLNALQSASVGIMGLALAAQKAIGIVGVGFGLAASLVDNTTSSVLYDLPASSVRTIVMAQKGALRDAERTDGALTAVTNQGLAEARLHEYTQYCIPVTITANVAKVLSSSKNQDGLIVTSAVTPVVTSALAPHISGIGAGTPVTLVGPATHFRGEVIVSRTDRQRGRAIMDKVNALNDSDKIDALAKALNVKIDPGMSNDLKKEAIVLRINGILIGKNASQNIGPLEKTVAGAIAP